MTDSQLARPSPQEFAESVREADAAGEFERVVELVNGALDQRRVRAVSAALAALRLPDRVDVFERLDRSEQLYLLRELSTPDAADLLEELADPLAAEVAAGLASGDLSAILNEMESDEAADVLLDLPPEQSEHLLERMHDDVEAEVRRLLRFPDDTAGGRMTRDFVALRAEESIQHAIERLRRLKPDEEASYYLYVRDAQDRLVGIVSLRQLIVADADRRVSELMNPDVLHVEARQDQEEAARLMARYDLRALPVTDRAGVLIGVITHDDLVDVLSEEATEDMYGLVGLDVEERPMDPVRVAVRKRLPWLTLNLGMQLALVAVLTGFRDTIDQVVALAVLFPLVTAQGGNVGAQTMTIVVRLLALGEFDRQEVRKLIGKEVAVGLINGVAVGLLAGIIALVVAGGVDAMVIATAMVLAMAANLTAGGLVGVVVPLTLDRLELDPAVASSVFVTALTDTLGVLLFVGLYLGLAGLF